MIAQWQRTVLLAQRSPFLGRLYGSLFAPVAIIGLIHLLGGVAVLFAPQAVKVSGLSGFLLFDVPPKAVAEILVGVGGAAIAARLLPLGDLMRLILVVPQQAVLTLQCIGVALALAEGAYPDGYVPVPGNYLASWWFIFGDQIALLVLFLTHTIEVCFLNLLRVPSQVEHAKTLVENIALTESLSDAYRTLGTLNEHQFWNDLAADIAKTEPRDARPSNGGLTP